MIAVPSATEICDYYSVNVIIKQYITLKQKTHQPTNNDINKKKPTPIFGREYQQF